MCFSPTISFTVGAALAATGLLTLHKTTHWQERLLAAVPLLFGIQQIAEGFLWLALLKGEPGFGYAQFYAVFVGIVWPVLIPLSLCALEPQEHRKNAISAPLALGIGIAFYTLYALLKFEVTARISGQCILYESPAEGEHNVTLYVAATCTAFFLSSQRSIQLFGAINLAAFLASYYFYREHLVSVWCLFAAVVSTFIYLYFSEFRRSGRPITSAT